MTEPMTGQEIRDTIRQMITDWDAATPEQREQALLVAERGADRAEAALAKATGMTWRRLTSGNWGAFGAGWFYLAGKLDKRWFLESWAADRDAVSSDPRSADEQFGFRRLRDAQAEAHEREEFAGLLHGKYGMPAATAHEVMATTRKHGWDEVAIDKREPVYSVLIEGWRLRTGYDQGGYTIEELEHEYGSAYPVPVPAFIDGEDLA